jgi:hypothetical protein
MAFFGKSGCLAAAPVSKLDEDPGKPAPSSGLDREDRLPFQGRFREILKDNSGLPVKAWPLRGAHMAAAAPVVKPALPRPSIGP